MRRQQIQQPNVQQYNPEQYPPYPAGMQPQDIRQDYLETVDQYGSIIKDLTDTDKILDEFELRLRAKKRNATGEIEEIKDAESYIQTDQAARDYVNLLRSIVNRHNDFSFYEMPEGYSLITGANYQINRWLLLQGKDIPTRYRCKISFEGMALISASIHKAMEGRMLRWTKGTFGENRNFIDNPGQQKQGFFGTIANMFNRRR